MLFRDVYNGAILVKIGITFRFSYCIQARKQALINKSALSKADHYAG
ncbi:hypothetical protein DYBT9623_02645 [Dyadobacter sp. CECT 9623]|jgi:hypothetical protein|uniref:Uncharacterized protein n=1 Tax=Dyadobacter linearis TaxID=2823330 RepID=A0ABM8UQY1_9BACT|nr:hypothetical protein DYBT9623_02645 [Dyadobacter sp. CECT 9623]